jgi:hypothetical protein
MEKVEELRRKVKAVGISQTERVQKVQGEAEVHAVRSIHALNCLANESRGVAPESVVVMGKLFQVFGGKEKEIDVVDAAALVGVDENPACNEESTECLVLDDIPRGHEVEYVVRDCIMRQELFLLVKWESSLLRDCRWVPACKCLTSAVCLSYLRERRNGDEEVQKLLVGELHYWMNALFDTVVFELAEL